MKNYVNAPDVLKDVSHHINGRIAIISSHDKGCKIKVHIPTVPVSYYEMENTLLSIVPERNEAGTNEAVSASIGLRPTCILVFDRLEKIPQYGYIPFMAQWKIEL